MGIGPGVEDSADIGPEVPKSAADVGEMLKRERLGGRGAAQRESQQGEATTSTKRESRCHPWFDNSCRQFSASIPR
jgi:hypothetical protein